MALKGAREHSATLQALRDGSDEHLARILYVAADKLRVDMKHSITEGSISGKGHIRSLPGQPPKRDTGELDSSIVVERVEKLHMRVAVKSHKAAFLEWGTSNMIERPYVRPAAKRLAPEMFAMVKVEVSKLVRESKR